MSKNGTDSVKFDYEHELRKLQIELLKFQNHVKEQGLRVLIIIEGRDAAGKGGSIKRLTEHLNPRGCRIVALEKPSARSGIFSVMSRIYQALARS